MPRKRMIVMMRSLKPAGVGSKSGGNKTLKELTGDVEQRRKGNKLCCRRGDNKFGVMQDGYHRRLIKRSKIRSFKLWARFLLRLLEILKLSGCSFHSSNFWFQYFSTKNSVFFADLKFTDVTHLKIGAMLPIPTAKVCVTRTNEVDHS